MYKILVIDDDKINRVVISRMLQKALTCEIIDADSGIKGLEALGIVESDSGYVLGSIALSYDLILCDIMMPLMSGFEFIEIIRGFKVLNNLPIIMITGANNEEYINTSFEKGANDYINKPVYIKELIARTKLAVELKRKTEHKIQRDKELMEDLRLATLVQKNSMPTEFDSERLSIKGFYKPVYYVSGDLYYWKEVRPGEFCIVLLDVMGHGIATSLITMFFRSSLGEGMSNFSTLNNLIDRLQRAMKSLNRDQDILTQYYLTAIGVLINTNDHTIEYFNCGHPRGLVLDDEGNFTYLESTMSPIGLLDLEPQVKTISGEGKKEIYLYTDGIKTELLNSINNGEVPYKDLDDVKAFMKAGHWEAFVEYASQAKGDDDITLIKICIKEH